MKKFTKKLSILFASLAMVMGVSVAKGSAKDVKATSSLTTILSSSDNAAAWTDDGDKYLSVSLVNDGNTQYPPKFNASTDIRLYNSTYLTLAKNKSYSGTVTFQKITITAKGSHKSNTQTLNYSSDGSLVKSGALTLAYPQQSTLSLEASFDNATSVNFYQSGSNNVQISSMKIEFTIEDSQADPEADLKAAKAVENMIDALPETANITIANKAEIEAASDAYKNLTDAQKYLVNEEKVAKLEELKAALQILVPQLKYTLDTATDTIATSNAYSSYTGKDSNETTWTVTSGSNQSTGLWIGINKDKTNPSLNDNNPKEVAIAEALGIDTNTAGWFGIVQEDNPMNDVGGITISYGLTTGDSTPEVAYILVSTDNGATYKVIDRHEMTDDAFNDGKDHVHIFAKNYKNALFAVIFDDTNGGTSATRLKAPKFDFYSYPNSAIADKFVELWKGLRNKDDSICDSLDKENKVNVQLLIDRYDEFDANVKAIVDKTDDIGGATIAESVEYVRNVLAGTQLTDRNYGYYGQEMLDTTIKMTESNSTITLVALLALVGIISVSAYYFIEKKRLAK